MRIFGQVSVGGFKMFDIDSFVHQQGNLRYATMSDITNVATSRTHIVASDMHGIRLEVCRLFSRGDIDLLFQSDFLNNHPTSMLYIDSCGLTHDSMSRDCKISLCFMSESVEEFEWLAKLAACMALTDDSRVKDSLQNLLTLRLLDDMQVLAFDNDAMETLKAYVDENYSTLASNVFAGCSQLIGLHDGVSVHTASTNLKGLFNHKAYLAADMTALKSCGRTGRLPSPIFIDHTLHLNEHCTKKGGFKLHNLFTKLIDPFCDLNSDFNNQKSD